MIEARTAFVTGLETSLRERVLNAQPIELLSDRGQKRVEVVEDINGSRFVRRSYRQGAIRDFEGRNLPFLSAWDAMHKIFSAVDIPVVSSVVFLPSGSSEFPAIAVSEYFKDGDVAAAPTDAKVRMATGLGLIPHVPGKYLPGFEVFEQDMFRVGKGTDGTEELVLVDVDPYLDEKDMVASTSSQKDIWMSEYIKRITRIFWNKWCQPSDRRAVFSTFIRSFGSQFDIETNFNSRTTQALMDTQAMSQGLNLRGF